MFPGIKEKVCCYDLERIYEGKRQQYVTVVCNFNWEGKSMFSVVKEKICLQYNKEIYLTKNVQNPVHAIPALDSWTVC